MPPPPTSPAPPDPQRRRYELRGQVQGVGFRPHVYRLATARGLAGFVANDSNGAQIEVEGAAAALDAFARALVTELPPLARITACRQTALPPRHETGFRIHTSEAAALRRPEVTPDAATCSDCRRELLDPGDRRHGYPFINCTNCGPRYSIIRTVPYDRPATTMAAFAMCPECAREYGDPGDRRFHAQPNACAVCGPQLELRSAGGPKHGAAALAGAVELLRGGAIVALKGIGGYHLACRADGADAVARLRHRKLRDGKPLAVMVPDVAAAGRLCRLTSADEDALVSPAAPIVLAPQRDAGALASGVAPGCGDYGLMLPYAPLHHLLFAAGLGPLVMTSANLAGQPLTYRDEDALANLADVADAFLTHNREIFRPIDDSVVFTFRDEVVPLRRARGYAPRPIQLAEALVARGGAPRILAVGGELKSAVCLLRETEAVLSEHLGDLAHPDTYRHFARAIERLKDLCAFVPEVVACDLHPAYLATRYARGLGGPLFPVQHHHAHIASVMAEWGEPGPVIGLACDGTGYGTDGAVWGGEVLICGTGGCERFAQLEYFPLVGGDAAAVETWRPAAALVRAAYGAGWRDAWPGRGACGDTPGAAALATFEQQATRGVNAPPTSSLGRVFDAVSWLTGLCARNRHEAEAAMALESAARGGPEEVAPYPYALLPTDDARPLQLSLRGMIREIMADVARGTPVALVAARFHETVARLLADAAARASAERGVRTVALSGGCFANRRLLGRTVGLLEACGLRVLYHRRVPSGDGGLALGQAVVAAWAQAAQA